MKKQIRISLLLDNNLLEWLKEHSLKTGLTQSYLLREWINSQPELRVIESPTNNKVSYSLRVDSNTLEMIQANAYSKGISTNKYIGMLISNKIYLNSNPQKKNLKLLLANGSYREVINIAENKLDSLALDETKILLKAKLGLDDFKDIDLIFMNLQKHNSPDIELLIELAKLQIMITAMDLKAREKIKALSNQVQSTKDRYLLGRFHYLYAKMLGWENENNLAIDKCENSLEYFDVFNHPFEIIESYLLLSNMYLDNLDNIRSNIYLNKAKKILDNSPDCYLIGKYYFELGCSEYLNLNMSGAQYNLEKSLEINKSKFNNLNQFRNIYNYLTRISVHKNKFENSSTLIQSSLSYEKLYRDSSKFSSSRIIRKFIDSKSDFKEAFAQLSKIERESRGLLRNGYLKYIQGTSKLLFAKDPHEQDDGASLLREVRSEGSYELIRRAAELTLRTGNIQPVR